LERHPGEGNLVVIDTYARFRPQKRGVRNNEYDVDTEHGAALQELAERHHACIVAVVHCRKMPAEDPLETVSGTVGLPGVADTIWVLRRGRGNSEGTLDVISLPCFPPAAFSEWCHMVPWNTAFS
jgi:hypothetical protein